MYAHDCFVLLSQALSKENGKKGQLVVFRQRTFNHFAMVWDFYTQNLHPRILIRGSVRWSVGLSINRWQQHAFSTLAMVGRAGMVKGGGGGGEREREGGWGGGGGRIWSLAFKLRFKVRLQSKIDVFDLPLAFSISCSICRNTTALTIYMRPEQMRFHCKIPIR